MRVLVGLATRGNDIHPALVEWMMGLRGSAHEIELRMEVSPHSAANGQQNIFEAGWKSGHDYVLIVDSDVTPTPNCVDVMVSRDKDILLAPIWFYDGNTKDIHLNVNYEGVGFSTRVYVPKKEGVEQIKTASFGCIMVARRVLEEFMKRGEKFTFSSPILNEHVTYNHNSDSIFFKKAQLFGFTAWVDWSLQPTVHTRPVDLCNETIENILNNCGRLADIGGAMHFSDIIKNARRD